jgi:hypothetical protein
MASKSPDHEGQHAGGDHGEHHRCRHDRRNPSGQAEQPQERDASTADERGPEEVGIRHLPRQGRKERDGQPIPPDEEGLVVGAGQDQAQHARDGIDGKDPGAGLLWCERQRLGGGQWDGQDGDDDDRQRHDHAQRCRQALPSTYRDRYDGHWLPQGAARVSSPRHPTGWSVFFNPWFVFSLGHS